MIAIGGVIVSHPSYYHFIFVLINSQGTGLFLGTASDLKNGGPAGLLIGYCIMASLLYSVMVRQLPIPSYLQKGLTAIYRLLSVRWCRNSPFLAVNLLWLAGSTRPSLDLLWVFCSGTSKQDCIPIYESLGLQMLQLYWCDYSCLPQEIRKYLTSIVVLPAEISAAAVLVTFWTPAGQADSTCSTGICNNAMWVGLMLIVVVWVFPKNWTTSDTDNHLVCYQLCGNASLW